MDINEIKSKIWDSNYKYFTLEGRIGKQEFMSKYVMPLIALIIVSIVFAIACALILPILGIISGVLAKIGAIIVGLLCLALSVVGLFVGILNACGQVRRFHDFGVTGWAILVAHIFCFSLFTLIAGLIIEGHEKANQYGEPTGK